MVSGTEVALYFFLKKLLASFHNGSFFDVFLYEARTLPAPMEEEASARDWFDAALLKAFQDAGLHTCGDYDL